MNEPLCFNRRNRCIGIIFANKKLQSVKAEWIHATEMFSMKEIFLSLLIIKVYLQNCKINADSANFPDTTANTDERKIAKNYFGSGNVKNNFTSETIISNNKTEDDDDDYYYEYSDRVLYLYSVFKNCYIIMSPVFLIVGTVGNFLSITVLKR